MCGIFGYTGFRNVLHTTIEGLRRLEYRGYDSAGIAGTTKEGLYIKKEVGKISALEAQLIDPPEIDSAIGQTRWATHGKPSKVNAHPHWDKDKHLAIVHNGIIENYLTLRKELEKEGVSFLSETDSEVIAHLVARYYDGDLLLAIKKAVRSLKGSFAFALVHEKHPFEIYAVAEKSPLAIGIGEDEAFIASDSHAFASHSRDVIFLANSEIACVSRGKIELYTTDLVSLERKFETLGKTSGEQEGKGTFEHYTLKEIWEQPAALTRALEGRVLLEGGNADFHELGIFSFELPFFERILILACGSSLHAGQIAAYMIEEKARIPVQVEIASEFRYKNPIIPRNTLCIAISQSGETADTVAAVREVKALGIPILALTNTPHSTLSRESSATLLLKAGVEVGVCSTKAFSNQLLLLELLALIIARARHMTKDEGKKWLNALLSLPQQVDDLLKRSDEIQKLAEKYSAYHHFFFLGRNLLYPVALEGALKLKEISYIHASGYPAGEMKHGPIALIGPDCPTVALMPHLETYDKIISNLMEIKARNGMILAVTYAGDKAIKDVADDIFEIPTAEESAAPILITVFNQLFAYFVAKVRGTDIDQPRNLAKSVTVE